jgi:uncharacterized protein
VSTLSAACTDTTQPVSVSSSSTTSHVIAAPATSSYTSREVSFVAGLSTAGTLTVPNKPGKHPAILFIAGSGPTDRNGDTPAIPGSIGTLKFLAEANAESAVTLRYDKVGVGASQPPINPRVNFAQFVSQAALAYKWLSEQPEVDSAQITIAGHSEGGLIALELAGTLTPPPAHLAMFSPPGDRYLSVIRAQIEPRVSTETLAQYDALVTELRATGTIKSLPTDAVLASLFNGGTVTFLADGDQRDPVKLAAKIPQATTVLLICGERDVQVSCESLDNLRTALIARLNSGFTTTKLSGTNHVLRITGAKPGTPETYADSSFEQSPDAAIALQRLLIEKK